jgi:hypothetical protein
VKVRDGDSSCEDGAVRVLCRKGGGGLCSESLVEFVSEDTNSPWMIRIMLRYLLIELGGRDARVNTLDHFLRDDHGIHVLEKRRKA